MKNPKVTVLMPVYNAERYLREAIDSILNQTFRDYEFLIINDASTDNTAKILKSYKDSRIRIITNTINLGLTKSLNNGLKIAKGEYVARQDGDDDSLPTRFNEQVHFLNQNRNIGLVGSSWYLIDEEGKNIQICKSYNGKQAIHFMCHGSVMIRKSALDKIGYYREIFKYAQDYDLWLRFSEKYDVANLQKPLYKLRVHQSSISSSKKQEQNLYAAIALRMAEQEKKTDLYRLNIVNSQKFNKILNQCLQLSELEKKHLLSHTYFVWSYAAYKLGDYQKALKYIIKGVNTSFKN